MTTELNRIERRVRLVAVGKLTPHPDNPRTIAPRRLEELKAALAADPGMLEARPLIALPDGRVVAGNQRLVAARELGWSRIPVITVDLDEATARTWMVRDNNGFGEWDEPRLAELLEGLDGSVDLALTGFDQAELDRLLAPAPAERGEPPEPGDVPAEPRSKPGEVYELGPHRLVCGDATDPDVVAEAVAGGAAEVLWTDPPYGVNYVGGTAAALTLRNDTAVGLRDLLERGFGATATALAPSARFYCAAPAGPREFDFRVAIDAVGWRVHQTLIWAKDVFVLGRTDYHYQHEPVLYGFAPGPGRPGRGPHSDSRWYGDHAQSSLFAIPRPKRSEEHPTMKPVELVSRMLANSARPGDIVLDPFAGSGTTMFAADQNGCRAALVEIDPGYCDVIRDRWDAWNG